MELILSESNLLNETEHEAIIPTGGLLLFFGYFYLPRQRSR